MIRIGFEKIQFPNDKQEWLETDGRGGYASSTLEHRHTRRYHGLLVANLRKPEGRHVLLSKLEDSLQAGGEEWFFSSHRYPDVLFPPGPPVLGEFFLDLCPRFIGRAGRTVCKEIDSDAPRERNPAGPLRPGTVPKGRHPPSETLSRLPGISQTLPGKSLSPQPDGRDRKRFPDRTLRRHAAPLHPDLPGVKVHPFTRLVQTVSNTRRNGNGVSTGRRTSSFRGSWRSRLKENVR